MKRILCLGFFLFTCITPLNAAEIFWNAGTPPDPVVTPNDFKLKYDNFRSNMSLEKDEVYDSGRLPDWAQGESEQQARPAQAMRPVRSRDTLDTQRPTERTVEPAPSSTTIRSKRRQIQDTAVESSPGRVVEPAATHDEPATTRVTAPEPEPRRGTPVPAIADEPTRPESKKLPWGQENSKPSSSGATEQQKTNKFQWGESK